MIFAVYCVDLLFISMLGNAELAAAVGYAGIILFFANSINIGLSIAAGSLVAKALGANKKIEAQNYATTVLIIGFIFSLVTLCLLYAGLENIITFLGSDDDTQSLSINYLHIILPTVPFASIAFIAMAVLRAYGDAKRAMYSTVTAGVINAILDPILIFGLDMGLEGAATASAISRICMLGMMITPVIKIHNALAKAKFHLIYHYGRSVFAIMIPAILANIATPIGTSLVTREMAIYGTTAVAGMAIIGRLTPVAFSVIFALSGAIGPIVGQNHGAGNMLRVKEALIAGLKFTLIYVLLVSVALYFSRNMIVSLFDATGIGAELVILFCSVLSFGYFFNGIIFVANACFNNMGHPLYSTYINWGRHTLGTLPFVLLGGHFWGASGILVGQSVGGLIFAVIALYLCALVFNKEKAARQIDEFELQIKKHKRQLSRN
jgi:putative MATE family efflux protein